jgi:hypothetical protein
MKDTASNVDVLSFHDYSPTREQIRANIKEAQAFAATVHKPVFNSEIGCIGRANPYDVTRRVHAREYGLVPLGAHHHPRVGRCTRRLLS